MTPFMSKAQPDRFRDDPAVIPWMELQHLAINQRGETIADFTETTFLPQTVEPVR